MITVFRSMRQILTYASILYFVSVRVFFYIIKWWFYIELWQNGCEIPPILPQTHIQRVLLTIIIGGYAISLHSILIQQSKYVRYYIPRMHKYVGYIMYISTLTSLILLPLISYSPVLLTYGLLILFSLYKSYNALWSNLHDHKWWSTMLYYKLYGIVFYQIVLSWFYTFSIRVNLAYVSPTLLIPLLSLFVSNTERNNGILFSIQIMTFGSIIYNLLVHIGIIEQK